MRQAARNLLFRSWRVTASDPVGVGRGCHSRSADFPLDSQEMGLDILFGVAAPKLVVRVWDVMD